MGGREGRDDLFQVLQREVHGDVRVRRQVLLEDAAAGLGEEEPVRDPNCLANLAACYERESLTEDLVPTPFNVFMHVDVDPATGALAIHAPSSSAGDHLDLRAERDLIVAVAACSAENTNGGRLKPIGVRVLPAVELHRWRRQDRH